MLKLNDDFSEVERQIEFLSEYFHRTGKADNIMACYQTYYALLLFKSLCDEKSDKKIITRGKDYVSNIVFERTNQIKNKFMNNFLNNKDFHSEMLSSGFSDVSDLFEEYCESDDYNKLFGVYNKPLDSKKNEDYDLLVNFFKDVNPTLNDLFLEMVDKKRFYKLNPLLFENGGFTVYNPIEKISNVIIKEKMPSIGYLATFVHEMGHVFDDNDFMKRFSVKDSMRLTSENMFIEVLSTYYEQRFYEWLLENNIRREETKLCYVNYMTSYLDALGDAVLFSLIPDEYHNAAVAGFFTSDDLVSVVEKKHNISTGLECEADLTIPEFDDAINYGYGFVLANGISHDEKMFNDYLNIRNGMFDRNKLINIGLTPETTCKKLIKNMEWFISK